METIRGQGGLRGGQGGKKMKKRKELDALVGGVGGKRPGNYKRRGSGGVSPQDQLLSESSGGDEQWSSSKGAVGKEKRHCGSGRKRNNGCTAVLRLCSILLMMACVMATITVMWLFIHIKEQTTYLRSQLDQVSAGSESIPEAIQKCHSLTRQLELNQTKIMAELHQVALRLGNFSIMISDIQSGLTKLQKTLLDAPELTNIPHDFQTLASSVAKFGSQISDLQITSNQFKEEHNFMNNTIANVLRNQSSFFNDMQELRKKSELMNPSEDQLKDTIYKKIIDNLIPSISSINVTLWHHMDNSSEAHLNNIKIVDDLKRQSDNLTEVFTNFKDEFRGKFEVLSNQMKTTQKSQSYYNLSSLTLHDFLQSDLSKYLNDSRNCKNCINYLGKLSEETHNITQITPTNLLDGPSKHDDVSDYMTTDMNSPIASSTSQGQEYSTPTIESVVNFTEEKKSEENDAT